jgi:PAS domain-containing protein
MPPSSDAQEIALVYREGCSERTRLADEYSRLITEFNWLLDALKSPGQVRDESTWDAAERARLTSQKAWDALEKHIQEHRCTDLPWSNVGTGGSPVLEMAALAALDVIMVANDDQRFVDVNEATADALGLPRHDIIGRRIDEFFIEVRGEPFPAAWNAFIEEGIQSGICELTTNGKRRRFFYRARANFAPGLHLGILREITEDSSASHGA